MPSRSAAPSARSRRTFAPVARSADPNDTSSFEDSFTTRSEVSSFIAETRVRSSTSFSSHQDAGSTNASSRPDRPAIYPLDSGGRAYGGSCSRPTTSTEPEAPDSRSVCAQEAPATPAPMIRKSTWRSATSGGARLARRLETRRDLFLESGVQHQQHLVARL